MVSNTAKNLKVTSMAELKQVVCVTLNSNFHDAVPNLLLEIFLTSQVIYISNVATYI